ncbi:hypothetical protein V2G26_003033 [Clonostachys chloroleuca]
MPPDKIDERVPRPSAAAASRLNHNNSAASSTTANINSPQAQLPQHLPPQHQHQHQHQLQVQHPHAAPATVPTPLAPPPQQPLQQSQPIESSRNAMERTSTHSLRAAFRSSYSNHTHNHNGGGVAGTIRAVTPEVGDAPEVTIGSSSDATASTLHHSSSAAVASHETSPRSIPSGPSSRRQGMVFNDSFSDAYESTDSSPPPPSTSTSANRLTSSSFRPRTRTMDAAMLTNQRAAPPGIEQRHRVGSMSSSGSQPTGPIPTSAPEEPRLPAAGLESTGFPTIMGGRSFEAAVPTNKSSDKKTSSNRRLMKRQSSHPAPHPPIPYSPSIDSLAIPIWIENPHRITQLMLTLCGKMRGEVEYQGESGGSWYMGLAYIDDDRGCLMFDSGQSGPFHIPIVADLRGCRVYPVDYPEAGKRCLELISSNPVIEVLMYPREHSHFDFWLAALLCWQQLRPPLVKPSASKPSSPASPVRPELKRRGQSTDAPKSSAVIKVGKVQVWDKGLAGNPYILTKRSSTRDPRSTAMAWVTVSFTLSDNGELKLMAENDGTILAIIEMSQLSRSAVQQLDKTVLGEDHCIAVFPMYALKARQLSVFRPVYLAAETRVQFEVWFALLRAFTVPDIYKLDEPDKDLAQKVEDVDKARPGEVFRVEKTIQVRVTEAKMKPKNGAAEASPQTRPDKSSRTTLVDPLVGNYLAEVMLDGEVRARTMTKASTKNPFWREDCEFTDLPPTIPQLSVRLKNVDGYVEPPHSPAAKTSNNTNEVICGTVDLSQASTDPASKDNEQWLPILDDKAETIGSMLIRVAHEELVVLLAKEYQPLAGIIHNFQSNLTTQVSNALPGHLRRVAELFLNIFQVSEKASDWIMAMVEDEIDGIGSQATIKKYRFGSRVKSNDSGESANHRDLMVRDMNKSLTGEANLLFRGNTLLTQSLEFHMRRLGKEFLEETLKDKIYEINEMDLDCEVDPSKLHQAVDLDQRWRRLIDITTDIWNCICTSAKRLHPELRGILKYIRAVAEDRYGDFLRTVAYTSVSGFLFLRFICPAILSPKLFGLLRDHPRPRAQRTFTLIAKALQKMANLSTFGKREEWMEPMNRFLGTQRSVFKDYVDQICDVPVDHIVKTIPPGYSTPLTIMNRLSPTAREGFPSLPFLIDQARNYASLVKLWVDAKPAENSKKVTIEGELLIFNDICFALQSRSDSCLAKDESLELSEFRPGMTTEELAEVLEQASLFETMTHSYAGSTTWTESEQPPGSSGSDTLEDDNRRSRDFRRTRDGHDKKRYMTSGGTAKGKNGKVGRTILNGIMRIGGRADSPEHKEKKSDSKSQK